MTAELERVRHGLVALVAPAIERGAELGDIVDLLRRAADEIEDGCARCDAAETIH